MNRKIIISLLLIAGLYSPLFAQHVRFPAEGVIEFERSVNTYAILQKIVDKANSNVYNQLMENFKKNEKQFKVLKSNLYFSGNKTMYVPLEDQSAPSQYFGGQPEFKQINTIHTDFNTDQQTVQKTVFDETFLVKDSTRHINWKITSETREIAGYSCRRANAIVMDSIYVVAFFTEQIPVSGGPEIFCGLPGMILGVALPHDNLTWFAKTVTDKSVEAKLMAVPVKGKVTTRKGLFDTLTKALEDWGSWGKTYMKTFML